jgi:hypothetical protein
MITADHDITEFKSIFKVLFWVLIPCSVVVEYQHFRGSCCFHLHFILKMEAAQFSKMVSYHNTTWNQNPENLNLNLHCCENLKHILTHSMMQDII